MADRPTTFDEIADRLIALESRDIVLKDLPLKQLMAKLQQDWDPDGTELIAQHSIGADALAPNEALRAVGAATQPPFGTNWSNLGGGYATAGFFKDTYGWVHLTGVVTKSASPALNDVIFTLPAGYRPGTVHVFAVASGDATDAYGRADVLSTGAVIWKTGGTGVSNFMSLDTIHFLPAT